MNVRQLALLLVCAAGALVPAAAAGAPGACSPARTLCWPLDGQSRAVRVAAGSTSTPCHCCGPQQPVPPTFTQLPARRSPPGHTGGRRLLATGDSPSGALAKPAGMQVRPCAAATGACSKQVGRPASRLARRRQPTCAPASSQAWDVKAVRLADQPAAGAQQLGQSAGAVKVCWAGRGGPHPCPAVSASSHCWQHCQPCPIPSTGIGPPSQDQALLGAAKPEQGAQDLPPCVAAPEGVATSVCRRAAARACSGGAQAACRPQTARILGVLRQPAHSAAPAILH